MKSLAPSQQVFVGIGANLEDPIRQVRRALQELHEMPLTRLTACSSLYRTMPVGLVDQPPFVNAVARLDTRLAPRPLLDELRRIEGLHGRQRSVPDGPRTLDLDLLLFADRTLAEENLTLPHPRMHTRAFVLVPLADIDSQLEVPGRGRVADLLAQLDRRGVEKLDDVEHIGVA